MPAVWLWTFYYTSAEDPTPWRAFGLRRQGGVIDVTYDFFQDTLENLVIAVTAAMS